MRCVFQIIRSRSVAVLVTIQAKALLSKCVVARDAGRG